MYKFVYCILCYSLKYMTIHNSQIIFNKLLLFFFKWWELVLTGGTTDLWLQSDQCVIEKVLWFETLYMFCLIQGFYMFDLRLVSHLYTPYGCPYMCHILQPLVWPSLILPKVSSVCKLTNPGLQSPTFLAHEIHATVWHVTSVLIMGNIGLAIHHVRESEKFLSIQL